MKLLRVLTRYMTTVMVIIITVKELFFSFRRTNRRLTTSWSLRLQHPYLCITSICIPVTSRVILSNKQNPSNPQNTSCDVFGRIELQEPEDTVSVECANE
jgi:hypothetical protein